ncbi:hypothetical protein [Streptomyces europaeiscabiei]
MLRHSLTDHVSGSRAVAFSPDGTLLATGCGRRCLPRVAQRAVVGHRE